MMFVRSVLACRGVWAGMVVEGAGLTRTSQPSGLSEFMVVPFLGQMSNSVGPTLMAVLELDCAYWCLGWCRQVG
ncbi:hypothetical protein BXZ70DRAFT_948037 [Cristinia sonorae]|uniref:Secreted protein n=1 Tax=Cristinia sonorae TaxID=1940300 RepID=A0A8K0XMU8_9AGAR|nr:hypothetical protein BXZ70DRAFT_948037 [Cristinia sonorae]